MFQRLVGGNPANPEACKRANCDKHAGVCYYNHSAKPEVAAPAGGAEV